MVRDVWISPIGYAQGCVPTVLTAERLGAIAWFVFSCNLLFLIGESVVVHLVSPLPDGFPEISHDAPLSRYCYYVYAFLFGLSSSLVLPQALSMSYDDYVNTSLGWKRTLFLVSMPLGTVAALQRRYIATTIPSLVCFCLVIITHVREFVLLAPVPTMLIALFRTTSERVSRWTRSLIPIAILLTAGLGSYIGYLRTETVKLPEEFLPRGMYLVIELVDGGMTPIGNRSLEALLKALAFPIYNDLFFPDVTLPSDPARYIGQVMTPEPEGEGCHYPFLWYTDVYLAAAGSGYLQGAIWGALFALWETAMLRWTPLLAVCLPGFCWALYMFTRGAAASAVQMVSRQFYFHIIVLGIGLLALWLQRNSWSMFASGGLSRGTYGRR